MADDVVLNPTTISEGNLTRDTVVGGEERKYGNVGRAQVCRPLQLMEMGGKGLLRAKKFV